MTQHLHYELPRALVLNAKGQPKDVHVHEAGTFGNGDPALLIDGHLYRVVEVRHG